MGMPAYLVVVLVVAAAVIAIFALSTYFIVQNSQRHLVEHETEKIVSEAENMFEYADEGSLVNVHVEFPDSLQFIVFGDLPQNGIMEPTNLALDENTSNNYYFVMNDGTIETFHSNARFSGKSINEIALFHKGVYDITLELVKENGMTYVKIY